MMAYSAVAPPPPSLSTAHSPLSFSLTPKGGPTIECSYSECSYSSTAHMPLSYGPTIECYTPATTPPSPCPGFTTIAWSAVGKGGGGGGRSPLVRAIRTPSVHHPSPSLPPAYALLAEARTDAVEPSPRGEVVRQHAYTLNCLFKSMCCVFP
jgi:hypothetical protein